jgi:hypothetical protein
VKKLTLTLAVILGGCAPPAQLSTAGTQGTTFPSNEQFFAAMTAPIDPHSTETWLNCGEFWKVQCNAAGEGLAKCSFQVSREDWAHAILARDSGGSWYWLRGDRLCPWTGPKLNAKR